MIPSLTQLKLIGPNYNLPKLKPKVSEDRQKRNEPNFCLEGEKGIFKGRQHSGAAVNRWLRVTSKPQQLLKQQTRELWLFDGCR